MNLVYTLMMVLMVTVQCFGDNSIRQLLPQVMQVAAKAMCTKNDDFSGVPNDCGSFYRCVNGDLVKFSCPAGTLFNYVRRYCDFKDNVQCLINNVIVMPVPKCTLQDDFSGVENDCVCED